MNLRLRSALSFALLTALGLTGCEGPAPTAQSAAAPARDYYGTLLPFASESVYFVLTDRFVNGDPSNDQRQQGGEHPTFDIPIHCPDGITANIGYLGGDFRGLLDNADYIKEMGFTSVWLTPIVDNPNEAFTGGDEITCTSFLTDKGKTGYHGYWGVNFYTVDEHLPSEGLGFAELTRGLRDKGLKTVLDIVGNHGSPAHTMPRRQPGFGQLFDAEGVLVADHQNLVPANLDKSNPLHAFYNTTKGLAQLSDLDPDNPAVLDYLLPSYLQWIEQGADAFRVDTIREQPLRFWKKVADRINAKHPGFFMFGEAFDYEAANIAAFTWPENGGYSLLDFPLKKAISTLFENPDSDFASVVPALNLGDSPFQNPYELTTFYDNHDMARMNASDEGFIDAHNWLFTARGIPVIYYGSEIGFMRGRVEHAGNRNYFGVEGIEQAQQHRIREQLARIAKLRAKTPALQRGLQLNLEFKGHTASFLRVFQHKGVHQTALVVLNKSEAPAIVGLPADLPQGQWRNALGGGALSIDGKSAPQVTVGPHDVGVWLFDAPITGADWQRKLDKAMVRKVVRPATPAASSEGEAEPGAEPVPSKA